MVYLTCEITDAKDAYLQPAAVKSLPKELKGPDLFLISHCVIDAS